MLFVGKEKHPEAQRLRLNEWDGAVNAMHKHLSGVLDRCDPAMIDAVKSR